MSVRPLHVAVVQGLTEVVDSIVSVMSQLQANVDSFNRSRQTPLHLAVITNQPVIVKKLLEAGASPNLSDRRGHNSIQLAVNNRYVDCLRLLLSDSKVRVDINAMNYEGLTALHIAAQQGHIESVEALLSAGAEINGVDGKNGRTALYYSAELGDLAMAELLLRRGASVYISSYSGCLPVNAARANAAMVKLLVRHSTGGDVLAAERSLAMSALVANAATASRKQRAESNGWKESRNSPDNTRS